MAKIKEIHIKNFKFFSDEVPALVLKDGSDHVLLYGENGSGKSTLNWALFTLLESANKDNPTGITKYFDGRDPQNLLNIHSPTRETEAFVKVALDDGTAWEISSTSTSINSDRDAQNSNLASDFINYRMLYRLLDFRNSQDIDLFPLFEAEVFDYLNFEEEINVVAHLEPGIIVGKIWSQIKEGPEKIAVAGSMLQRVYEQSGPTVQRLRNGTEKFFQELRDIIRDINPKANAILKDDLDIDIKFKLELTEKESFSITQDEYKPPSYRIDLKIEGVGEEPIPTTNIKPHIFLNEARLTAIGLAIRLSILEKRLAVAKLKLLVLDDLLISLDMSNRMKVVNMILKNYCQRYQVFMMTHDKNFYELVKFRIEQENHNDKWNFWETYVNKKGTYEQPFFKFNQSSLSRAEALFHEFDYPASGNYLRKAVEEFVDKWLPNWLRYDNKNFREYDLSIKLNKGKKFLRESGINIQLVNDMDLFRKFILNALSHAPHDTPVFKPELEQCLKTLKEDMPKFQYKQILDKGDKVFWEFTNLSSEQVRIEVTVFDLCLLKWDTDESELSKFIGKKEELKNGTKGEPQYSEYNLKNLYASCVPMSNPSLPIDFWDAVKLSSGALLKTKRAF